MASTGNGNGKSTKPDEVAQTAPPPVQVKVVAQYIKDLSFENPNIEKLLKEPGDQPNLQLSINVGAKSVGPTLYESAIDFNAQATNKHGEIYQLELVYAGLFKIENIPERRSSRSCSSTARRSCSRSCAASPPT